MEFDHLQGIDGVILNSHFNYNDISHALEVKVGGLYFIYAQLAVKCIADKSSCNKSQTVKLIIWALDSGLCSCELSRGTHSPVLTISLRLSTNSEETLSKFSAVLRPLKKGDSLCVKMDTNNTDIENWQLDQTDKKDNFFGLFKLPSSAESVDQ